ncbi:MAG: ABC transporter ATP-binding protein [Candidatus Eiseniibacteriota bacterium]
MAKPLLVIDGISKSFRGLRAVSNVSFTVEEGGIVGLIGPNGAGKTTCFNMIAGVFRPDGGQVRLGDKTLTGLRPDQICRAGVARTFQLVKPFKDLTVEENVVVGALCACDTVEESRATTGAILERLGLRAKRHQRASELTLPDRKRLEVARALATRPTVLLLDEVMAGLRPTETDEMVATFQQLNRDTGLTILLIEHVMRAVMALSQHIVVLHHGEKISEGTPEHVVRDQAVLDCYLGEEVEV